MTFGLLDIVNMQRMIMLLLRVEVISARVAWSFWFRLGWLVSGAWCCFAWRHLFWTVGNTRSEARSSMLVLDCYPLVKFVCLKLT